LDLDDNPTNPWLSFFLARDMPADDVISFAYATFAIYEATNMGRHGYSHVFSAADLVRHMENAGFNRVKKPRAKRAKTVVPDHIVDLMQAHEDALPLPKQRRR
jgi:hypothetical protein